jgi:hypothetical protein
MQAAHGGVAPVAVADAFGKVANEPAGVGVEELRCRAREPRIEGIGPVANCVRAYEPVLQTIPVAVSVITEARHNASRDDLRDILDAKAQRVEVRYIAFLPVQGDASMDLVK